MKLLRTKEADYEEDFIGLLFLIRSFSFLIKCVLLLLTEHKG